jgi:hypothetical protein
LTNPWILPTLRWCSPMPAVEPLYHPLIELKKGPQGRTKLRKGPTGPTAVVFLQLYVIFSAKNSRPSYGTFFFVSYLMLWLPEDVVPVVPQNSTVPAIWWQ